MERFNLQKLSDMKCNEVYQVKMSHIFATSQNLVIGMVINMVWENIRIKEFSKLYQRKEAAMYRLQDPTETNGNNPNNLRHEVSKHLRNKKRNIETQN
jgi:hypothetical protein